MTLKRIRTLVILVCAGTALSACTAFRPPAHQLMPTEAVHPGGSYTVKRGENLYAIAQRYKVRVHQLIALNKLRPPYYLRPGSQITIPSKGPIASTPEPAPLDYIDKGYMSPENHSTSVSVVPLEPVQLKPQPMRSLTTPVVQEIKPLPPVVEEVVKPSIEIYAPPAKRRVPEPKSYSSNNVPTFGWPVRGTIISTYGPKGKGRDNDGINITAPKGSPVKASEAGIIVYAGQGMKGFGNLVLIKHSKGWVTAYAHMERLTVKKNAVVKKGSMIGTVGSTGGVSSPQLHFEARRDGVPVDPELVIK